MEIYYSRFGRIELTRERLNHILRFHPEVRSYRKYFPQVLSRPDIIRRSKFDDRVIIFYKRFPEKFLAIVFKINKRNFILTAYLTSKIQHQRHET